MVQASQAVILAAGRGTRLQRPDPGVTLPPETEAIAAVGIKALVPIGGRPYLDYGIERLVNAGIRRVVLILAAGAEALERYVHSLPERFPGLETAFVIQPEPLGTGHALRFARPATGMGDFLLLNSDNLYPESALKELADAPTGCGYAVGFDRESLLRASNMEPERVPSLGILVPDEDDPEYVNGVVEKPANPDLYRSHGALWVTMNVWRFMPNIYDFCDSLEKSPRGEYELTSAVQHMINRGTRVRMLRCTEGVLDLTSRHDILRLEKLLGT